jgi:hypothetical protein
MPRPIKERPILSKKDCKWILSSWQVMELNRSCKKLNKLNT